MYNMHNQLRQPEHERASILSENYMLTFLFFWRSDGKEKTAAKDHDSTDGELCIPLAP